MVIWQLTQHFNKKHTMGQCRLSYVQLITILGSRENYSKRIIRGFSQSLLGRFHKVGYDRSLSTSFKVILSHSMLCTQVY